MKHLKLLLFLFVVALAVQPVAAQKNRGAKPDRKEWMAKMREVKHEFLSKELQLTDAQKKEFFEIYDKSQEARHKIEHDARQREKVIEQKGDAATDAELEAIVNDQFTMEARLNKVDREYLPQMRKVLTLRQLSKLKHAERKFMRKLMEKSNENCPPPPVKPNK